MRSVRHNNRKRVFDVRTSSKRLVFPYSKADPVPTAADPVAEAFVDNEVGGEAFPSYLRNLLLYKLTLEAQGRVAASALSKREIIRRLGTSATQLYRLLDQTNYRKSVDQLVALLQVLDCEIDVVVRTKTA